MATINNIYIDSGADFSKTISVTDTAGSALDLTGYTAAGQIRKTYESSSATVALTVAFISDRTTGQITISLTGAQTGAIDQGRYVYDVLLTSGSGGKSRAVEGIATFNPRVTQ
jgi:hypothetical protein